MTGFISSPQNRYLKLYRSLAKRRTRDGLSLLPLEGIRLVKDALQRGIVPEAVLLREGESWEMTLGTDLDVPVFTVEQKLFDKIAFTDSPQGIIAIVPRPAYTVEDIFSDEKALILIADRLQDPGNLGTMIRSAAAAGASGAVLLPGTVDVTNPKVLRATMGTYFDFPVVEASFDRVITRIRERGIQLVTTSADADIPYDHFDWTVPTAVLIGNEGTGVSEIAAQAADAVVSVPMSGDVESLNAAVAMSVIFFEAARQRRA
ncbi:MAG: RNA methyltransferase [Clostridiales bacterium]|nr:RNA methyltransferase [Clostridiales bacterium]